ncbi:MAG TPA: glycosyltransferase [Phycisphaerales bacterium]|nr:glycosyltransferase [Phycisphaerales bacterium]
MNNTIGLIFSKDRAMQLQADIESFYLHCNDADSVDMAVLYKASDQRHRSQYDILKRKFTSINFIEENNFRSQTLSQLNGYEYVLFLVDDNMFIKPFTVSQAINCLQQHGDAIGFSLRLGKNATYCYALNVPQNLPVFQSLGEKAMKYNWTGQQSDFNYPLEVSSSIYKIADIMPLLTQLNFNNPNTLEGAMARNAKLYRQLRPSLLCYEYSVAFCNPVNIVQQTAKNRYGTVNNYTAEQLADLFAQGMSIDVAKYKDFTPNSIHQEVQLHFKKDALSEQQSGTFANTVKDDMLSANTAPLPQFSIIMANYNNAKYISEAIESVLKQTFTNWQLIIVEDGSSDDSLAVINRYSGDWRIRLIRHEKNSGYTVALKTGIANLQTELFGILDSDDCLTPDAIETMYAHHIDKPDCGMIYSQFHRCHEDMSVRNKGFCKSIPDSMTNVEMDAVSHFKTFKLSHYLRTPGYDEDIMYAEDKDISYRMEEVSKLFFVDKSLYCYRELPDSIGHAGRTAAIGEMAMGKAKINAFIRRKILSTKPILEDPRIDAKPLLDQLKANHPGDLALFLDVLELAWHRQLLDNLELPAQSRFWSVETIVFWMACDVNLRDIIDLIGNNILNLYSEIKQIQKSHKQLLKAGQKQSGTAATNIQTSANSENIHTAVNYSQKTQQEVQLHCNEDALMLPLYNKKHAPVSKPTVTVVSVNHNTLDFIKLCVSKVFEHTEIPLKMIVVDNNSTDGSLEYLQSDPRVRLLFIEKNMGHGPALDLAMKYVDTEYVVVLDSDAHPIKNGWLRALIDPINDEVLASGVHYSRQYVHPCCMALKVDTFIKNNMTYRSNWPPNEEVERLGKTHWDVGENISMKILQMGKKLHYIPSSNTPTQSIIGSEYGGIVYHHFYGTRIKTEGLDTVFGGLTGSEIEQSKISHFRSINYLPPVSKPTVTVVSVNHNTLDFIKLCVSKVFEHTEIPLKMIVVDNNSTDGSLEYLRSDPRIKVFGLEQNIGHGQALDLIMKYVDTEYVVVIDSDAHPIKNGWLKILLEPLSDEVLLSGIYHHRQYVHPACMALKVKTFTDNDMTFQPNWPPNKQYEKLGKTHWDVGEYISMKILKTGKKLHYLQLSNKPAMGFVGSEYGGIVYHHFFGTRIKMKHSKGAFGGRKITDIDRLKNAHFLSVNYPQPKQKETVCQKMEVAIQFFRKAQQAFADSEFQTATDYIGQYKAKMDYSLLPVTVKPTAESDIPEISVVIVTYNRSKEVRELIGCLAKQDTSGFEVIVVDNSDGKDEDVSAMVDKYIDCPINFNLSEGRNIGSHFAKGRILVFLDDDALINSDYIASIKQAFSEYDIFGLRGRAYPKTNADANDHVSIYNMGDAPLPTFCNQEGNSAFLRDVYMEMNGMDPLLFGHEGSELTYRIIKKYGTANKIIYWPQTIIYHDYGIGEKLAWKRKIHEESRNYIAAKHAQNIFELRRPVNAEPMPPRKTPTNYSIQSSAACDEPKVSIVIACYNCAEYLPECMESINKQVFTEWELFLIDDASTDNTPELIRKYAARDKRIRPYYFSDNAGPYIRRNFAIEHASSDFIVIQDADDIMDPVKLRRFYSEITADPGLGVVGSYFIKFLDEFRGTDYADMHIRPTTHKEIMEDFQESWYVCWHASAIIRKELFTTLGLYDTQPYGSDTIWLAKAAIYALETDNIRIRNIPEVLTYKRECSSSQTGTIPINDPRGRRKKLNEYMINKLEEIQRKYRENPALDVAKMIRNCTFADFIPRFGHLFEQWETQPLTDQMIRELANNACVSFFAERFISCLIILNTFERIAPDIFNTVKMFNLIRGLSYFALDMDDKSYVYMSREYKDHNSEAAFEFVEDYLNGKNETLSAADRKSIVKNVWHATELRNVSDQTSITSLKKGAELLNASKPQEALVCFDRALNAGCNISYLHQSRLLALIPLERFDEAELAYDSLKTVGQNYIPARHSQDTLSLDRSVNAEPIPPRKAPLNYSTPATNAYNAPKVSIVIACYNCAKYLPECVESINKQTLTDWELFLVDDASTDNTPDLIRKYAAGDKRIKPYYFSDNTGPYIRRNFAIEKASSDFIVIQDADDIMHPAKLRRFYDEITADPRLGVVGSFFSRFLDEFKGLDYADTNERLTTHEEIMNFFKQTWHICWHASAIIRKDLFTTIGLYDTQPYGSDTAWLAKAGLYALETGAIRIKNIPEVLTHKRECLSSQTGKIPLHDPRGRRRKLEVYIINKLEAIQKQYRQNPSLDIAEMIRNCTFSDFIPRFGHLFEQWETQPLNDDMIKEMLDKAFPRFTIEQFVASLAVLNTLEQIEPDIFKTIKTLDIIRGLSYFALDMEDKSYIYMSREYKNHNSETAFEFIENYLNGNNETLSPDERKRIVKNTWYSVEMRNVPNQSSVALLKKGAERLNASRPQEALEYFDRAFNAGCNISCLHQARAAALMQLGRNDEASLANQMRITAGLSQNKTKLTKISKENNLQVTL